MFVGYQNGAATFIANTREELINNPCIELSGIKEVEFAEMYNGVIYTSKEELLQAQTKAVEETRAALYTQEVDPITAHINRLRDEELTPEVAAEIAALVEERKALVAKIKEENPYPAEPIEEIEELPAEEEAVSETENTTEEID